MSDTAPVSLPPAELRQLLEDAASAGAAKALAAVGLHDEAAGGDVRDLRALLKAWRAAQATVAQTALKVITTAVLGAILGAVGFAALTKGGGG